MKLYKIKKSNIDRNGRGLYATKNIKAGTKIIEYVGNIITKKQTEISDKFDNSKPIYLFNLNKRYDLDGAVSWNTARLINHSCSNNTDYEGIGLKIWVVSNREIKKGEEITCDYGFGYDLITDNFLANANLLIAVVILLELKVAGELKNLKK